MTLNSHEVSLFGLQNKGAFVVGGGAGIGEATAKLFAKVGARVVVLDRDLSAAKRVVEAINADGGVSYAAQYDILDEAQVDRAVAHADELLGGIDVMTAIVGRSSWGTIMELDARTWQADFSLNLFAIVNICKATAKAMIARKRSGAIAVLTSVSGTQSAPIHAAYGAAKAALVHAVKTMAVEWAEDNIRVNSVAPGGIVTPRLPETPERIASFRNSAVPMRRRGVPEDIANALLYLTSDMSDYVTGHTLLVDGGVMASNLRYKHGKLG